MDNTNRKIVLLKGDNSKCYEQAIFILRPQAAGMAEIDFVKEAERIISGETLQQKLAEKYGQSEPSSLRNNTKKDGNSKPPKNSVDKKLNIALIVTGLVLVAAFLYNII
ncbi:MAG: hypothetical protein FWE44_01840 [Defluviitaleaceae bacterium]|nr:hypothetical protein [Defluviitaleaceae bacterium]